MKPEEIRELRKKLGLTQEEFAAKIGTTGGVVSQWELGKSTPRRIGRKALLRVAGHEK